MERTWKIALAEMIGTGFLVVGGCGTAVIAGSQIGAAGVATAFGLSLLIMAYAIGHISGCHINPAVTVAMALAGKIERRLVPVYIGAQLVGGIAGGLFLRAVLKTGDSPGGVGSGMASNGFAEHSPSGYALSAVILVEIAMTAFLIFVVLSTTHERFPAGFGGIAAGTTLWLVHLVSIPVSNTSVNPARSLGVAVWAALDDSWPLEQIWVFLVFPVVGAVFGTVAWRALQSEDPAVPAYDPDPDDEVVVFDDGAVVDEGSQDEAAAH